MSVLLALIELLQSWVRRILPSRPRHGYKLPPSIGDKHRHSPQKPEWLKHEIIRLKALMPQAGCRTPTGILVRGMGWIADGVLLEMNGCFKGDG